MTGEEAIKAAEELAKALDVVRAFGDAAALRALLPLARTGLLVERTLASMPAPAKDDDNILALSFSLDSKGHPVICRETTYPTLPYEDIRIETIVIGSAPTLAAAVEAALKGQQ